MELKTTKDGRKVPSVSKKPEPVVLPATVEKPPLPAPEPRPRLPDGATFHCVYDAARVMWTGTLTVGETEFRDSWPKLFTLHAKLDKAYRASVRKGISDDQG